MWNYLIYIKAEIIYIDFTFKILTRCLKIYFLVIMIYNKGKNQLINYLIKK